MGVVVVVSFILASLIVLQSFWQFQMQACLAEKLYLVVNINKVHTERLHRDFESNNFEYFH